MDERTTIVETLANTSNRDHLLITTRHVIQIRRSGAQTRRHAKAIRHEALRSNAWITANRAADCAGACPMS